MGLVLVLALSGGASAAHARTCADGYLLCLNDASQAESGRTWKELGCLRTYGSCLREQAFGS
jgi:hypothetical protein